MSHVNDFIIENDVLVGYTGSDADVVIPPSVTLLGDECFCGCHFESITIPASVTSLGK